MTRVDLVYLLLAAWFVIWLLRSQMTTRRYLARSAEEHARWIAHTSEREALERQLEAERSGRSTAR
jgi:hypothetical protein